MQSRQVSNFKINKMTKAQYSSIVPSQDEVYITTDEADAVLSVNGILPNAQGNVTLNIPTAVTESTVAGWGFTKNVGTVTSVNGVSPTNGNVAITIPTVNNGTLTITQDGNTLGTFGANQSGNSTINTKGLYDYNSLGFNITGNLINNGSIYSGFDSSNYATMKNQIELPSYWEYGIKFTTGTISGGDRFLIGDSESTNRIAVKINGNTNVGMLSFSFGSTWNLPNIPALSDNTTYVVKLIKGFYADYTYRDTSVYIYVYDKNGNELGNNYVGNISATAIQSLFGTSNGATVGFGGSIDFENTYFNVINYDGTTATPARVWTGAQLIIDTKADVDGSNINQSFSTNLVANMSDAANIYMSSIGMPSDTYINLTLGASGSTYTAPSNGWFCLQKVTNNTNQYVLLQNLTNGMENMHQYYNSGYVARIYLPCKKNDTVRCSYTANGNTTAFRFIYAVGSESEV